VKLTPSIPVVLKNYVTIKGAVNSQSNLNGAATTTDSKSMNMEGMMNNMKEYSWREEYLMTDQNERTNSKILSTTVKTSEEPQPVAFFKQNEFGIRALNMGFGEWGLRTLSSASKDKLRDNHFIVVGTLETHTKKENSSPSMVSRFPWEGFEEVGFRTVKTAMSGN
jgi:hypothetical protein